MNRAWLGDRLAASLEWTASLVEAHPKGALLAWAASLLAVALVF